MLTPIFSPNFVEQTDVLAGKLADSIHAFQHELLTSLVYVDFPQKPAQILLFARGQLATVYRSDESVQRLDPTGWLAGLNGSSPRAGLRILALTPQDIRIFKILIEQRSDLRGASKDRSLEQLFTEWKAHPVPALVQVRWPKAEALLLFPGQGASPNYSLFITANQLLHSAGSVREIQAWKEGYLSANFFSSDPATPAWIEYLLHNAFSSLVCNLFEKFEKLVGRILLNQVVRDVNFKATAHDWNVRFSASSVNDQTVFASPASAGETYARLLEVIFQHFSTILGDAMLEMLLREAIFRLPVITRQLVSQYMPVTNLGHDPA